MRLLVIEDEVSLADQLSNALLGEGFRVEVAHDGEQGLYIGKEYRFDLVVIDLGLPKISGIDLIAKFRKLKKEFPILVLTARDDWKTKVEALNLGADDYLTKPFQMEEFLARVHALLRRSAGYSSALLEIGGFSLDAKSQQVKFEESNLDLTAFEYKIMEYLMLHPKDVVSKSVLIDYLYDQDYDRDSNVIEVFIARLRKKIDPAGTIKPIETLRGRGYKLNTEGITTR
ncbi:MAG: DNA-binding response regulator [Gammaproteobacteria bacterium]|nr:MAG: DNA-binding response regulator [Gammaproteobacteria bacterium]